MAKKISPAADLPYWVALAFHPMIGARSFGKLLTRFPSMESVWRATPARLQKDIADRQVVAHVLEARQLFDPDAVMRQLAQRDIGVVALGGPSYPSLLAELPDLVLAGLAFGGRLVRRHLR